MRANGVKYPKANLSGKGPIFDTSHLDGKSPRFKAAYKKCAKDLVTALKGLRPTGSGSGHP
jgi:hypothetical protein